MVIDLTAELLSSLTDLIEVLGSPERFGRETRARLEKARKVANKAVAELGRLANIGLEQPR